MGGRENRKETNRSQKQGDRWPGEQRGVERPERDAPTFKP